MDEESARVSPNESSTCENGLDQAEDSCKTSGEESGHVNKSRDSSGPPENGDDMAERPAGSPVVVTEESDPKNDEEPNEDGNQTLAALAELTLHTSSEVVDKSPEEGRDSPRVDDSRSLELAPPSRDSQRPEAASSPSQESGEVEAVRESPSSGTDEKRPVDAGSRNQLKTPPTSNRQTAIDIARSDQEEAPGLKCATAPIRQQSSNSSPSSSPSEKRAGSGTCNGGAGTKTLRELAEEEDEPAVEEQLNGQAKESESVENSGSTGTKVGGLRTVPPTGDMAKAAKAEDANALSPQIHQGKLFEASYLGSTQIVVQLPLSKSMRVTQAYEAVSRVKQPEGESQPMIPIQLEISTESIKIINDGDKMCLMDHPLRSISYVADIGKLVIIMARRRLNESDDRRARTSGLGPSTANDRRSKLLCHVLESEDAHHISETIGLAFNFAYRQFLRQNGIDEEALAVSDYADILSVQRMPQDDLQQFVSKEGEKEVQISKRRGEILGVSVMESGWGSMVPSVMVVHMQPGGAASRSGVINVGDQLTAVSGKSLVGLSLAKCLEIIKGVRSLTTVKVRFVKTTPVLDVNIVRPDAKFPLGFSVADGTITSLLRGSIGERGGIRVGHRIIEMNGQSTINMPPSQLIDMLHEKTGHIQLKTMPLHMFRIVTGQLVPEYF